MAAHPGRFLAVGVAPGVIQHADLEFGDAAPRRFPLHFGREEFYIAVGPWVIAVPRSNEGPGKSLLRFLLSFLGRSGQGSFFVYPLTLPRTGGKRDTLV